MRHRYLEITFRRGRMLAAYLHLPHEAGDRTARTVPMGHGLMVDYSAKGLPIGVEITAPKSTDTARIDALLARLRFDVTEPNELAPLKAA